MIFLCSFCSLTPKEKLDFKNLRLKLTFISKWKSSRVGLRHLLLFQLIVAVVVIHGISGEVLDFKFEYFLGFVVAEEGCVLDFRDLCLEFLLRWGDAVEGDDGSFVQFLAHAGFLVLAFDVFGVDLCLFVLDEDQVVQVHT